MVVSGQGDQSLQMGKGGKGESGTALGHDMSLVLGTGAGRSVVHLKVHRA